MWSIFRKPSLDYVNPFPTIHDNFHLLYHLLMYFGCLFGKQDEPRWTLREQSSLIRVHYVYNTGNQTKSAEGICCEWQEKCQVPGFAQAWKVLEYTELSSLKTKFAL